MFDALSTNANINVGLFFTLHVSAERFLSLFHFIISVGCSSHYCLPALFPFSRANIYSRKCIIQISVRIGWYLWMTFIQFGQHRMDGIASDDICDAKITRFSSFKCKEDCNRPAHIINIDIKWFGTRSNACFPFEFTSTLEFTSFHKMMTMLSWSHRIASHVLWLQSIALTRSICLWIYFHEKKKESERDRFHDKIKTD